MQQRTLKRNVVLQSLLKLSTVQNKRELKKRNVKSSFRQRSLLQLLSQLH